jgi:hypothetical protein
MQFLYGLLTAVVFFIALLSFYYIGLKQGKQQKEQPIADEEEVRKAQKIRSDFQKLMNYDVDQATARKKVT